MIHSTNHTWKVIIGIVLVSVFLLLFFADFLKEIGMHRLVFSVCVYFCLPVGILFLVKILKVR